MTQAPKKVLHVMNAAGGGAALSTLSLMKHLRTLGVQSCAVCNDAGTDSERAILSEATGGEVVFTPLYWWNRKIRAATWKRPLLETRQLLKTYGAFGSLAKVVRAIRDFQCDLVHTNTILTPEGGRAAAALGLPHVWHVRELTGANAPFQLPLKGKALTKYLRAHASQVIANSNASAAPFVDLQKWGQLTVVPNGIELAPFEEIVLEPEGKPVVAMLGNLTSRTKKHRLFIDAAEQLPEVEFRIYGHLPEEGSDAYVDEIRKRCAFANVKLMGFVAPEVALADLHVMVQPADNESFGRTVIEAMAAGRPVVGANGGGVAETVVSGETGLLFPPDSVSGLVDALRKLCASPELRKKMGTAGRLRARKMYGIDVCVAAVLDVYRHAMNASLESQWTSLALLNDFRKQTGAKPSQ